MFMFQKNKLCFTGGKYINIACLFRRTAFCQRKTKFKKDNQYVDLGL